MPKNIKSDALKISEIILATNTDDRGILFKLISQDLRTHAQGFTSQVFAGAASGYGYPEDMIPSYERKKS